MSEMTESQHTLLREKLEGLQHSLQEQYELGLSGTDTVNLDQSKVGRLSRMDALQQQKMAESTLGNTRERLKRVRIALRKFDSGDYGYCEHCGEDIAFPRLEVQPEAAYCMRCQTHLED